VGCLTELEIPEESELPDIPVYNRVDKDPRHDIQLQSSPWFKHLDFETYSAFHDSRDNAKKVDTFRRICSQFAGSTLLIVTHYNFIHHMTGRSLGRYEAFIDSSPKKGHEKIETELKFLLSKLPSELVTDSPSRLLRQSYLDVAETTSKDLVQSYFSEPIDWKKIRETRIRAVADEKSKPRVFSLTLKSDGLLQRTEIETSIDQHAYDRLARLPVLGSIEKRRFYYKIADCNLTLEIDEYFGHLTGLFTAEVEYDPAAYPDPQTVVALVHKVIGTEAIDVTLEKKFKNVALACRDSRAGTMSGVKDLLLI
jgi:CYTH domain-containing protein